MHDIERWLRPVAAAHAAGAEIWHAEGVTVRRVPGGNNNALYRVEADGACYACKLCVDDDRRRAAHEYGALRLFQEAGIDVAPEPLGLDEGCTLLPYPAVVYRWLPGMPLRPPLTAAQLALFLATFQAIHALRPDPLAPDDLDSWFHWFDFAPYLDELAGLLGTYGPWLSRDVAGGAALRERLAHLVEVCAAFVAATDVDPGRECVALRMCRVDANLDNTLLGPDGRLRWVDWEYCGWGDPALDLCELRWHAALEGLDAAQQRWLRDHYRRPADDAGFEARLAVWDRIISTRWCFLILRALWSLHNGPDRVRLTRIVADPDTLHARLVRFVARAERVVQSTARDGPMG